MVKHCLKCNTKKMVTKHHVFGKRGLCGLPHDSTMPLMVLLTWLRIDWDDIDIIFWKNEILPLCRNCHDEFHLLFVRLLRKCDIFESEEPFVEYIGSKVAHIL